MRTIIQIVACNDPTAWYLSPWWQELGWKGSAANAEHLAELDLNPVLTGPNDVVAVDWLLVEK